MTTKPKKPLPINEVLELCGGRVRVANYFGIKHWAVCQWVNRQSIPPERCRGLVELSDGKLKLSDLRPDLWD